MAVASRLGRLNPSRTILLLCDIQERFAPTIQHFDAIVETSVRLTETAKLLNLPYIVTEQYPKGLGYTVAELKKRFDQNTKIIEKTQFSMCTTDLMDHINKSLPNYESVVLCGVEAHACVLGTCLDFLSIGKDVHVVADAVSSRSLADRKYAFKRMEKSGAYLTTAEAVMFLLCKNANHPKFRDLQKLIKTPSPDSSLLQM